MISHRWQSVRTGDGGGQGSGVFPPALTPATYGRDATDGTGVYKRSTIPMISAETGIAIAPRMWGGLGYIPPNGEQTFEDWPPSTAYVDGSAAPFVSVEDGGGMVIMAAVMDIQTSILLQYADEQLTPYKPQIKDIAEQLFYSLLPAGFGGYSHALPSAGGGSLLQVRRPAWITQPLGISQGSGERVSMGWADRYTGRDVRLRASNSVRSALYRNPSNVRGLEIGAITPDSGSWAADGAPVSVLSDYALDNNLISAHTWPLCWVLAQNGEPWIYQGSDSAGVIHYPEMRERWTSWTIGGGIYAMQLIYYTFAPVPPGFETALGLVNL